MELEPSIAHCLGLMLMGRFSLSERRKIGNEGAL